MKKAGILVLLIIILGSLTAFIIQQRRGVKTDNAVSNVPVLDPDADIPEDWRTYENELGFRIKMPTDVLVDTQVGENSVRLVPNIESGEFGPVNFVYVSVVKIDDIKDQGRVYNYNSDQFTKLMDAEVKEKVSLLPNSKAVPDLSEWFTYERFENTFINGNESRVYINNKPWEFPIGVKEIRYIIPTQDSIFIVGAYYGGDISYASLTRQDVENIISTFKIL